MYIQNKKDRSIIEKIPLNHGECIVFGLLTNRYWLHEVPKDVHMEAHPLYGKSRISFTFRRIDTYIDTATGLLYGQGSPFKSLSLALEAQRESQIEGGGGGGGISTLYKQEKENTVGNNSNSTNNRSDLIHAFHLENRQSDDFDWEAVYGKGFLNQ